MKRLNNSFLRKQKKLSAYRGNKKSVMKLRGFVRKQSMKLNELDMKKNKWLNKRSFDRSKKL